MDVEKLVGSYGPATTVPQVLADTVPAPPAIKEAVAGLRKELVGLRVAVEHSAEFLAKAKAEAGKLYALS